MRPLQPQVEALNASNALKALTCAGTVTTVSEANHKNEDCVGNTQTAVTCSEPAADYGQAKFASVFVCSDECATANALFFSGEYLLLYMTLHMVLKYLQQTLPVYVHLSRRHVRFEQSFVAHMHRRCIWRFQAAILSESGRQ